MSDVESRRSLVTGATGYVGGHLAALLVERGQTVRAMARTPQKLDDAPWRDEVIEGLMGADVIGFQRSVAAENFVGLAHRLLGLESEGSTIRAAEV